MNSQTTSTQPQDMTEEALMQELAALEVYSGYLNEAGQRRYQSLLAERDNRNARARYSYGYYF